MKSTYRLLLLMIVIFPISQNLNAEDYREYAPRARVIIDNDFAGDPDGVVALAHHLLSHSVDIVGVIGSYFPTNGMPGMDISNGATEGVAKIKELYQVMGLNNPPLVYLGGDCTLVDTSTPVISDGAQFIVDEAMREDTESPLYVACGGSLNTIASALLMKPEIADRMILIWIGGPETLECQIVPPGAWDSEYNLNLDIKAAQVVFNRSGIPIWMVPRAAYRQCNYSHAEMSTKIKGIGTLGDYLYDAVISWFDLADDNKWGVGETYVLGDSPLVLLTALQSFFEPDPSSCDYVLSQSPKILDNGTMQSNPEGRIIRIYTHLDTRLMFADLEAKLKLYAK